jgi:hypothetical protein
MRTTDQDTYFAATFLDDLRKVFRSLNYLVVRETRQEGVHYFVTDGCRICLYNIHPEGIQLIFNRNLLTPHFKDAFDLSAAAPPDWNLLVTIIVDITEHILCSSDKKRLLRWKPEQVPAR